MSDQEYEDFMAPDAWGVADAAGILKEVHLSWEHARMVARAQGWTLVTLDRRVEERVSAVEHSPDHIESRTEYGPSDAGIVEFIPHGFAHVATPEDVADLKRAVEQPLPRERILGRFVVARTQHVAIGTPHYDSYENAEDALTVAESINDGGMGVLRADPLTEVDRDRAWPWSVIVEPATVDTSTPPVDVQQCCDRHPDCMHVVLSDGPAPPVAKTRFHVAPVGQGRREHTSSPNCWCGPAVGRDGIVRHRDVS